MSGGGAAGYQHAVVCLLYRIHLLLLNYQHMLQKKRIKKKEIMLRKRKLMEEEAKIWLLN